MPRYDLPSPEEMDDETDFVDEEEEGPTPTRADRLPPPVEIGGSPGYSEIHGSRATIIGGRATSPRLFTSAAGHPTAVQLRVWKVENGVAVALGAIDAQATEEDLVRMFRSAMPRPGEGRSLYKIRPIDAEGREMGVEAPVYISEHHATLQSLRAVEAGATAAASAPIVPSVNDSALRIVEDLLRDTRETLREERRRNEEILARTAEDRIGLASSGLAAQQQMAQSLLDVDARRAQAVIDQMKSINQQSTDSITAFFTMQMQAQAQQAQQAQQQQAQHTQTMVLMTQQLLAAQQQQAQQALADAEARAKRAQEEYDRRRSEEQREHDRRLGEEQRRLDARERVLAQERADEARRLDAREREEERKREERARREAEDARARDAERDRAHQMAMRALELERAREKEHAERMAELQRAQYAALAASTSTGGIKTLISEATGLLTAVGVDPRGLVETVIERFRAPTEEGASSAEVWADLAGKVLGTVGEVAKAKLIADAQAKAPRPRVMVQPGQPGVRPPPGYGPPQPLPALPAPPMGEDDGDDDDDDEEADYAPVPRRVAAPARPVAQPAPAQPAPGVNVPGGGRIVAGSAPGVVRLVPAQPAQVAEAQPAAGQPAAPVAPPAAPAAPGGAPVAAPAGLDLPTQRAARKALRALADRLRASPDAGWQGLIVVALTEEPAIFRYVQAVTVRAAVMEASDQNAAFTDKVIAALRDSPLVPGDLNYG